MEKLLETLGLKADATEEEAIAKVQAIQKESKDLAEKNQELTVSVKEEKTRSETLETAYKGLLESKNTNEEKDKPKTLFDELAEN